MPIPRLVAARRILERQLAVATVVTVAAAVVAALRPGGPREVTLAAAMVELWAVAALVIVIAWSRECIRDRIGDGDDPLHPHLAAEARRIAAPEYRERLARSLLRALADARDWPSLAIASRPPPPIRNLGALDPEVAEIVALLRDPRSPVRGVALVERLVRGGSAAVLYAGPRDRLEREVGRIRFILAGEPDLPLPPVPRRPGGPASSRTARGAPSPVRTPGRW
jgi:hypothetical protein